MNPRADLVRLDYQPPYDWPRLLRFLAARSMKGVESVSDDAYLRTIRLDDRAGWILVRNAPAQSALLVEVSQSLSPALPALVHQLQHLFDLSAHPDIIAAHLARDARLAGAVSLRPGLRVPGACDGFELAARAILGKQTTVKAATTLTGRFAAAFGDPIDAPHAGLTHLSPTSRRIALASIPDIASLGIIQTRARSIIAIAQEMESGRLLLEPGAQPAEVIAQLVALPGVGATARHRRVDRALHRDASPALARRLPERGRRPPQRARSRHRGPRRGALAAMAPVAQLCHTPPVVRGG